MRIIAAGLPNPWTARRFSSSALSPHQLYHHGEADRTRLFSAGDFGTTRPAGWARLAEPGRWPVGTKMCRASVALVRYRPGNPRPGADFSELEARRIQTASSFS